MGITVDVIRSRARVPMSKASGLLLGLAELDGDEDHEVPYAKLVEEIKGYLVNHSLEPNVLRIGDRTFIDIEFASEKWCDETIGAFRVISKFVEGESYFMFSDGPDIWRYVLTGGEVREQSVVGFLWATDGTALNGLDLDIDIDVDSKREELKVAL